MSAIICCGGRMRNLVQVMLMGVLLWLTCCSQPSVQDVYMHNPRGSNNRLNEQSAQRANGDRLFDSQNNNRGGYNVGDATNAPFQNQDQQYQMRYFQSDAQAGTFLDVEWTDQHGCGGNEDSSPTKQNCILVLQYMCQTADAADPLDRLRDGNNTQPQAYEARTTADESKQASADRRSSSVTVDRAINEPWSWYDACYYRERNQGLFTADQGLQRNKVGYSSAIYTRQNPGGNRRGYECPEERDYFPYWHPTPWKDIAVLTSNVTLCQDRLAVESFNVKPKHLCVERYATDGTPKHWSRWNNEADCTKNGGKWTELYNYLEKNTQYKDKNSCERAKDGQVTYKWAVPYDSTDMQTPECLALLPAPECRQAEWTRSNHLGNARDTVLAPHYLWTLPYFPSSRAHKCVLRLRYNISTDDYDPFGTFASQNNAKTSIRNNPLVDIGVFGQPLQLAINTAQYGRVFQDRSHTFFLLPRPNELAKRTVHNLNVRGKRGNIVQVYPAVEYDFTPTELRLRTNDILHVQWTGSNTHHNDAPGGDGQITPAEQGPGRAGTDRSNLVQIAAADQNYPLPYESTTIWRDVDVIGYLNAIVTNKDLIINKDRKDLALYLASSAYYMCASSTTCAQSFGGTQVKLDPDLNNAPASLPGVLIRFTKPNQVYYFMSSRNNDFSNRSQKGKLIVTA